MGAIWLLNVALRQSAGPRTYLPDLVGATGFEPVTPRLYGVPELSQDVALRRLKCQLAVLVVARSCPVSPRVCRRWLPIWPSQKSR